MAVTQQVDESGRASRSSEQQDPENALADTPRSANARPACFRSGWQEIFFIASVTMAIGMSSILAGSITVTSAFIGRSLHMTTAQITWLFSASSLSCGAFILSFGMVADIFGRKSILIASLFLFAIFCVGAGFLQSGIGLDVIMGVLGLFSASATPAAAGVLGVTYDQPGTRRNAAFASFSAGNPLGFVCGTIFGGIAADLFGWRASLWLMAIIFAVFTVVAVFCVPADSTPKQPLSWATLSRFDILGTLLIVGGVGMFSAALSLGEEAPQGWKTGYVLALLMVGIVLIGGFILWEFRFPWPLMPMGIWKDRNFTLVLTILSCGMISFAPTTFFLALYIQDVWHKSPLLVAVYVLPMAVNGVLVNVFAGVFLHKISNKTLMYVAVSAYTAACLLFALNKASSSYWSFCFPGFILIVIGADLQFNVANMYVMSSMPPSQQSLAGGIFQTVTKLCQTIGVGFATVVFDRLQHNPTLSHYWDAASQPYAVVFLTSMAISAASFLLVPFLTINTQGGQESAKIESTAISILDEKAVQSAVTAPVNND